MILTVTPNTTLDLTIFIPTWEWNRTIRATGSVQSMGGKPTDASWILGELGIPSLALGFAGGATGQKVEAMLRARGVQTDFVQVEGDTRINVVVALQETPGATSAQTTLTTSTLDITPAQVDALRARYAAALDQASCVVLGGTLPRGVSPDLYVELITMANARGVPTIFDAAEPILSAGLAARPTYIKPNHHELEGLVGTPIDTLEDAYHAGHRVIDTYGVTPIISLGERGLLAVLADRALWAQPLAVEVVSASGAGDAILAGLAASIERGQPMMEGLRLGVAAASAVCLMPGTADCRREDVERFLLNVTISEFLPERAD